MRRRRVLTTVLFLSFALRATAGERPPHLVRFTSERSAVRSGGHMSPGCFTILTAQIAPPAEGVEVGFRIGPGTGEGRASPAMLSRETARTDVNGLARTFLLSSDAEEDCRVEASLAPPASAEGQAPSKVRPALRGVDGGLIRLEVRVRFSRSPTEGAVVAPRQAAGPGRARRWRVRPLGSRGALSFARYLADPAVEVRTAAKRALVSLGRQAVEALVEVASDPKFPPEARRLAVTTLAEITDEEAHDQLLALLAHPLPNVRTGAEEAVARIAVARALPLARAAVLSAEPGVRSSGLRVLGTLPTDPAASIIASKLADPDPFVRATAAWEIARSGPGALSGPGGAGRKRPGAEGSLGRALADRSPFVRAAAAKAVLLLGAGAGDTGGGQDDAHSRALARALARALKDKRVEVRCAAAKAAALREAGPQTALGPLTCDPDPRVRRSAALGLTWRSHVRSSLRLLRALGRDPDPPARKIALRATAELGGEAEMGVLVAMTSEAEPELRELAVRALRRLTCLDFRWRRTGTAAERDSALGRWREWWPSGRGLRRDEWLWQALELPGSELRGRAGLELARIYACGPVAPAGARRREALVDSLRRILARAPATGHRERRAAAEALVLLGDEKGIEALAADIRDRRSYVRLSGARTLASATRTAAVREDPALVREIARLLVESLADTSVAVRRCASRALVDLTGESFGFEPQAPAGHREVALAEWRKWLAAGARLSAGEAAVPPRKATGP